MALFFSWIFFTFALSPFSPQVFLLVCSGCLSNSLRLISCILKMKIAHINEKYSIFSLFDFIFPSKMLPWWMKLNVEVLISFACLVCWNKHHYIPYTEYFEIWKNRKKTPDNHKVRVNIFNLSQSTPAIWLLFGASWNPSATVFLSPEGLNFLSELIYKIIFHHQWSFLA